MESSASQSARWKLAWWVIYWCGLAAIMHWPLPPGRTPGVPGLDKVIHATAYLGLAYFAGVYLVDRHAVRMPGLLWRWAAVFLLYGIVDECLQPLTHRTASVWDFAADAVGVLIGSGFWHARWRAGRVSGSRSSDVTT